MVVGLVPASFLKRYARGNVATGRVSQAGQVASEVPDKERDTLVLQVWGWALN